MKVLLSEVIILVKLLLMMPATNATSKQSFSTLRMRRLSKNEDDTVKT